VEEIMSNNGIMKDPIFKGVGSVGKTYTCACAGCPVTIFVERPVAPNVYPPASEVRCANHK
jgi:hypothetical protein